MIVFERRSGVRSSGTLIIFWLFMIVYSVIKLRTLFLLSRDYVRIERDRGFALQAMVISVVMMFVSALIL